MFIEINRGREFRGLTKYCIYDEDRQNNDRVAFVETRNLATEDPEVAWRIMASKAYMQDELKERAGVAVRKNNGKPVGHVFISWGKEEAEAQNLDREGMVLAVDGALKSIGAEKNEATIVAHRDTKNPHCHIILNLICDDGRLLKSSHDHSNLSRFALEEEIRVHGKPIVKDRHKRWCDREAGETPAPRKKKARQLYELEKAAEQDNEKAGTAKELLMRQKLIQQKKVAQQERQARNRERLLAIHEERQRRIKEQNDALIRRAKSNARNIYNEPWLGLHADQQAEMDDFDTKEKSIRGSIENGLRLVNWSKVFERPSDSGKHSLKDLFQTLTSEGKRREILQQRQEAERQTMRAEQRKTEQEAAQIATDLQNRRLDEAKSGYVEKAAWMKDRQQHNEEKLKADQQAITAERNVLLKEYRQQQTNLKREQALRMKLQQEFGEAAKKDIDETTGDTDRSDQGDESTEAAAKPKRQRNPRDPEASRRKRDVAKREEKSHPQAPAEETAPRKESTQDFEDRIHRHLDDRDRDNDHELDR